jgi:guanylate kinase
VVIIGPNKNSIIDNLVALMADKYKACVPHSTRAKREEETHGEDYFFVSKEEMQALISTSTFVTILGTSRLRVGPY